MLAVVAASLAVVMCGLKDLAASLM